ncbi:MAG: Serine/threonine-protein kinase pkn1 [Betaproteobacteria bacterium ADurb.Bin341]|nr:MAG: Serine/threonine-protein kinase pkn1 [Betaproteobacteria bacterium ADurb.Bin341]
MANQPTYRIFISSPSDVNPERLVAQRVVERLDREFAYHFRLEPVLWEREPLIATEHFQTMIVPPSQTDIVVVLLWSRLGSPLPQEHFRGAITGKCPVTGTEWEFEDAVKAYREGGKPDLLLYRKKASIPSDLDDEAAVLLRLEQKRQVEEFVRQWFVDEADGSFKAASHVFENIAGFEEMLEIHLRALLKERLTVRDTGSEVAGIRWHRGSPFRGLESFDLEHKDVFFGRTQARHELREVLKRRSAQGNAFVLVLGASGSGKSSLIKAGLLPDLLLPGMMERVGVCRYTVLRPGIVADDLVGGLAKALLTETALPEIAAERWDEVALAKQLRQEADLALMPILKGLDLAGKAAQLTEHGEARLAVIVDQFEELFTQPGIGEEQRVEFVRVLAHLAKSGVVWVIAAMRSDFAHKLETLPLLKELTQEGEYHLFPPEEHEFGQVIEKPAQMAGLRFETDEIRGIRLDEEIRRAASSQPGSLPLLEFVLEQLWQQRTDEGVLTFAAYERMGGLRGALGRRAEELFQAIPREIGDALPGALRLLVTVGQGEGIDATARVVPIGRFPEGTAGRKLVEAFLAPEARLLVADEGGVRLAHEALLTHWERAREQIEVDRKDYQVRGRLELAAKRWQNAGKKEQDSLLLPPGVPLLEGKGLLECWRQEIDPEIETYIRASLRAAKRRKAKRIAAGIGFALLIPVVVGGYFGTRIYLGVRDIEPKLAFAPIPAGCFLMGSPEKEADHYSNESPQHEVCVKAFQLGKFEVTQGEWEKVMLRNPASFKNGPEYPVETVSWDDAQWFIRWLNLFGKHSYRLPTEAEWEYAARAGSKTAHYWGDGEKEACGFANVMDQKGKGHYGKQIGSSFDCNDGYVQTAPVGKYQPNAFGLHDMLGNVTEWVQDWYDEAYYAKSPKDDPSGPEAGKNKVNRGGSWYYVPARIRSAYRVNYGPDYRNNGVGLRLLRQ